MSLNLESIVESYVQRDETPIEIELAKGDKVRLRRITSSAEQKEIRNQYQEWAENARALAPNKEVRHAIGELEGSKEGKECMFHACLIAAALVDSTDDIVHRRYQLCLLAAKAGATFNALYSGVIYGMVSDALQGTMAAHEGKAGSETCPSTETDSESVETSGESTPTN